MYYWGMGWEWMKVARCDICGHRWLPEREHPTNCPKKSCRSMLWDSGGVDRRTKAARIKAGRSRKPGKQKKGR
jgi:hypothetical protein